MGLVVYLDPFTINSRKVLAALELIGTKYEVNAMDYMKGEQKNPEFGKINPMQSFPAATDGDLTIFESNAILAYAAEGAGKYYGQDLKEHARINSWLLWEACAWFPSCYAYVVENVVKPAMYQQQPDQSVLDAEAPKWAKLAKILDGQLSQTKYLVGNEVTIADIAVASPIHIWKSSKLPVHDYPNLSRWYKDIQGLECWKKTQAPVTKVFGENVD